MIRRLVTTGVLMFTTIAMTGLVAAPSQAARPPAPWGSAPTKIVAIGDSFTSGFGFYGDGDWMAAGRLPWCKPGDKPNDACSSNSNTRNNDDAGINFSSDWGYKNQISWAANFAWSIGIRENNVPQYYRNFAVTGSTAKEWANDELKFSQYDNKSALDVVAAEKPNIVLMTLGGNPTLSKILFGAGNKCAVPFINKWDCFKGLIDEDGTEEALQRVYTRLLNTTDAIIIPVVYPQIVPAATLFTAEDLIIARNALNDSVIKSIDRVRERMPQKAWRLLWTNKDFMTGVMPGNFSEWNRCYGPTAMGWPKRDGLSNQSSATQAVFSATRKLTGWCSGDPWVISQDTGIHPNKVGYERTRDAAIWRWENWPARVSLAADDDTAPEPVQLYAKTLRMDISPNRKQDIRIPLAISGPLSRVTVSMYRNIDCPKSEFRANGKPKSRNVAGTQCEPSKKIYSEKVPLDEQDNSVTVPAPGEEEGTYSVIFSGAQIDGPQVSADANMTLNVSAQAVALRRCVIQARSKGARTQGEVREECKIPKTRL